MKKIGEPAADAYQKTLRNNSISSGTSISHVQTTDYTYLKAQNTRTHIPVTRKWISHAILSAHTALCRWLAGIWQNKFSFPSNYSTLAQAHTEFGEIKQRKKKKKMKKKNNITTPGYARCPVQVCVCLIYLPLHACNLCRCKFVRCVDVCSCIYVFDRINE